MQRRRVWRTCAVAAAAAAGGGYVYDRTVQASAVWRTLRTFGDIAVICADYKINFRSSLDPTALERVHQRAARRLLHRCQANGGLFIKFGQSIAVQSALLPSAFRSELQELYDSAPSSGLAQMQPVIERSLGRPLPAVFAEFSPEAVASASVAQVHRARLHGDPPDVWVAVKVQKPEIKRQIGWDLFALRTCARMVERAFGIPLMWSVGEVERRLREELDFLREAHNSERAARDLDTLADGWLRRAVHVPPVRWSATAREVLTTEWVDGVSLVDPGKVAAAGWRASDVMRRVVALFAFQVFVSGNVHGDPHPGNILVRPTPGRAREPQVVLLDHGLYVRESTEFRRQFAEFWRAAALADRPGMARIALAWGMPDAEAFAAMMTLRPTALVRELDHQRDQEKLPKPGSYTRHMEVKQRAVAALRDARGLPPELVFVVRNANIVRAHNQRMGIPVNRTLILGQYAALGLRRLLVHEAWDPDAQRYSREEGVVVVGGGRGGEWVRRLCAVVRAEWRYATFCLAVGLAATLAALNSVWVRAVERVTGRSVGGDGVAAMDEAVRRAVEAKLGYSIDASLFSA
ncbi:hypothetical protein LPJ53_002119 [Coemansia erecta]|uniref:ABC1 atypical kinase-like domain-containing protein n=1 Tax=Coemansia erecta TaxID=147472 RepID=A0A9W8CRH0_9FUNG|nr:hypothetical protein LPJ53_002119 [Coemansia erecta]